MFIPFFLRNYFIDLISIENIFAKFLSYFCLKNFVHFFGEFSETLGIFFATLSLLLDYLIFYSC